MKHIQNDIALLTLAKPVVLSDRINTVCLPQQSRQVPAGTNCYITGSQSKSCTHVMNITLAGLESIKKLGKFSNFVTLPLHAKISTFFTISFREAAKH